MSIKQQTLNKSKKRSKSTWRQSANSFKLPNNLLKTVKKLTVNILPLKKKSKKTWRQQINNFNATLLSTKPDERFYNFSILPSKSSYNTYKIKYAPNNIFCHVFNNQGETLHPAKSFGNYKIKVSKKNKQKRIKELLQRYSNEVISNKRIKRTITPTMVFKLQVKNRIRKRVARWIIGMVINKVLKKSRKIFMPKTKRKPISQKIAQRKKFTFAFDFGPQKPFNGCRGVVFRRKKRVYPYFKKKYLR